METSGNDVFSSIEILIVFKYGELIFQNIGNLEAVLKGLNQDVEKSDWITSDINRISPVFIGNSNSDERNENIINAKNQRINIILRDRLYDMYNVEKHIENKSASEITLIDKNINLNHILNKKNQSYLFLK